MFRFKKISKERYAVIILGVLVFLVCMLFFSKHPFVLFDMDDVLFSSSWRKPIILPGSFNPIKVFPELAMSASMHAASTLLMPLTGDFIDAVKIMNSFIVSGAIAIYSCMFFKLLRFRVSAPLGIAVIATLFFFVFHFLIFRNSASDNSYMFWVFDVNCVYNYLLPNLLCASLVMYFMRTNLLSTFFDEHDLVRKAIIVLLLYLALCSNLFCNIILVAYVGVLLVTQLMKERRIQSGWPCFLRNNAALLLILVFWFGLLCVEATGERAASLSSGSFEPSSFFGHLEIAVGNMCSLSFNKLFILALFVTLVVFIVLLVRERATRKDHLPCAAYLVVLLFAGLLTGIYIVLLCSAVKPVYVLRSDVTFGFFFYGLALLASIIAVILGRHRRLVLIAPLLLFLCVCQCNTSEKTYADSIYGNVVPVSAATAEKISKDIISEVVEASASGAESFVLKVPIFDGPQNWPLPLKSGWNFAHMLQSHGIIDEMIDIEVVPDMSMNQKYGIPAPDLEGLK